MAHQDGRCASDAETLYVGNVGGCSSSDTGGTASQPLCTLQAALTRLTTNANKRLIVLRSSADGVSVTNATQVSIVGQNSASIATGAVNPGISVSGTGNLYVRSLNVVGSSVSTMGISAGPGTTLRLERAKVLNNGGGGILLNGAAFDFEDVLVSGNGTGIDGSTTQRRSYHPTELGQRGQQWQSGTELCLRRTHSARIQRDCLCLGQWRHRRYQYHSRLRHHDLRACARRHVRFEPLSLVPRPADRSLRYRQGDSLFSSS
jgi:hypothetical protein